MELLEQIQEWYLSQCNEDWEHSYGVKIDTLDNPGWRLNIDVAETVLESKVFNSVKMDFESDSNWLHCKVEDKQFVGMCGPLKLSKMLSIFIEWANGN
jgi:hypothetical protein